MTNKNLILLACSFVFAGTAFAHNGVENAAVMARMNGMTALSKNLKVLGTMAKGATPFDATAAQNAAAAISKHAAQTPDLFRAQEDDPKSEAKSNIWQNFDDFTSIATDLEKAALRASKSIAAKEDLGPVLSNLGATCKACHSTYRE